MKREIREDTGATDEDPRMDMKRMGVHKHTRGKNGQIAVTLSLEHR